MHEPLKAIDNAHARFLQENGRPHVNGAVLDLCNGVVSEKTAQIFGPPLPAEYVTVFSGRTDALDVSCDIQTDPTTVTLLHARRELIKVNMQQDRKWHATILPYACSGAPCIYKLVVC